MLCFHVKFVQTDRWTTVKQYIPRSFDTGALKRDGTYMTYTSVINIIK